MPTLCAPASHAAFAISVAEGENIGWGERRPMNQETNRTMEAPKNERQTAHGA